MTHALNWRREKVHPPRSRPKAGFHVPDFNPHPHGPGGGAGGVGPTPGGRKEGDGGSM
jgi:hypothetical protein